MNKFYLLLFILLNNIYSHSQDAHNKLYIYANYKINSETAIYTHLEKGEYQKAIDLFKINDSLGIYYTDDIINYAFCEYNLGKKKEAIKILYKMPENIIVQYKIDTIKNYNYSLVLDTTYKLQWYRKNKKAWKKYRAFINNKSDSIYNTLDPKKVAIIKQCNFDDQNIRTNLPFYKDMHLPSGREFAIIDSINFNKIQTNIDVEGADSINKYYPYIGGLILHNFKQVEYYDSIFHQIKNPCINLISSLNAVYIKMHMHNECDYFAEKNIFVNKNGFDVYSNNTLYNISNMIRNGMFQHVFLIYNADTSIIDNERLKVLFKEKLSTIANDYSMRLQNSLFTLGKNIIIEVVNRIDVNMVPSQGPLKNNNVTIYYKKCPKK